MDVIFAELMRNLGNIHYEKTQENLRKIINKISFHLGPFLLYEIVQVYLYEVQRTKNKVKNISILPKATETFTRKSEEIRARKEEDIKGEKEGGGGLEKEEGGNRKEGEGKIRQIEGEKQEQNGMIKVKRGEKGGEIEGRGGPEGGGGGGRGGGRGGGGGGGGGIIEGREGARIGSPSRQRVC